MDKIIGVEEIQVGDEISIPTAFTIKVTAINPHPDPEKLQFTDDYLSWPVILRKDMTVTLRNRA